MAAAVVHMERSQLVAHPSRRRDKDGTGKPYGARKTSLCIRTHDRPLRWLAFSLRMPRA